MLIKNTYLNRIRKKKQPYIEVLKEVFLNLNSKYF